MNVFTPTNSVDFSTVLLWQYQNATRLKEIIDNEQDFFDENVTSFWDDFYTDIFNLETATTFGLRIWGVMLGVERPRYLVGSTLTPFTDETYRKVLKSRLLLNTMNGTVPEITTYLNYLFPNKPISFRDGLNMTITYQFLYTPSDEELAMLAIDGILPRPAGVNSILVIADPDETFGFEGQEMSNFDNSVFA